MMDNIVVYWNQPYCPILLGYSCIGSRSEVSHYWDTLLHTVPWKPYSFTPAMLVDVKCETISCIQTYKTHLLLTPWKGGGAVRNLSLAERTGVMSVTESSLSRAYWDF